jgi:4-amino-4-deoxy-L-arabinose transferase-like glycosyltransferase
MDVSVAGRQLTWLLVIGGAVLFFFDAGARVLATNDEARFPVMARDILASGRWLLPEVGGAPMLNKPPLHAWLIALGSWPVGAVTQRTAALPSGVAALGVVLATAWIGGRVFNPAVGIVAGLLSATMAGTFDLARSPVPDMTLTLAITVAMAAFAAAELGGRPRLLLVFYALTGVAFWTKGPAGLLPLGAAILYQVRSHGWTGVRRLASPPGLGVLIVLVVPWWLLATHAGGALFVRDVVVSDMLQGYFTLDAAPWRRVTSPIAQASAVLLPWSMLLPVAAWSAWRRSDPGTRLALAWAMAVFALTALSHRQRFRYYAPLCPPVALLVAAWLDRITLPRRATLMAVVWIVTAASFAAWEIRTVARRNTATELQAVVRELAPFPGPVFASDAPEIVFAFYLERPVVVASYEDFAQVDGRAYLIASERQAQSAAVAVRRVAAARVADRPFVLLGKE